MPWNIRWAGRSIARTARATVCLLPYVMRYNLSVRQKEMAKIAMLLGEDVAGLADRKSRPPRDRRR